MRTMLKSKIHRARVTRVDLDYEGSITLDKEFMEAADILPYEMVHILDINNGQRFTTYAIEGERGSREVGLNGAAARLVCKGDIIIILTYSNFSEEEALRIEPTVVHVVDDDNNIMEHAGEKEGADHWMRDLALSSKAPSL
ncbi:aspartate 1-decarboxylase [Chloroflexota bacterium]